MSDEQKSEAKPQRQTGALVFVGAVLVIAGIAMTRGNLGPVGGLIVAMLGIALIVVGLVRR